MKNIFLFLAIISLQYNGLSQSTPPASMHAKIRDRVEVRRAAFLSQRLQLTPEEAQVFFPLFNEYVAKMKLIRQQAKPEKKIEDFNEADAEKAIAAQFDVDTRIIDLKKEYYQKFKKILSAKRIALLYKTEREFKGELLHELQNRRGGQMRKPRFAPKDEDR
jgi:hypothetical protein